MWLLFCTRRVPRLFEQGALSALSSAGCGLLCSVLLACGTPLPASEYARVVGCDADSVVVTELSPRSAQRYSARGCGKTLEVHCWDDQCAAPAYEVQRRHARQFGCLPRDVTAVDREEGHFIGEGCGQRRDYQCRFDPISVVRCDAVETASETAAQ